MSKNRPLAISALVASAVAAGAVAAAPAMAAETGASTGTTTTTNANTTDAPTKLDRIGGDTRYETAINASQAAFPTAGSAKGVVIARGDVYVDALAGTPLAAKSGSALLLTDSKTLTAGVADEIKRLLGTGEAAKKKTITILGGEVAVTPAVEKQLKALGYTVDRVGGFDRYATALGIAGSLHAKNAIVATGMNFADALAAGPLAAAAPDSAIVLSNGGVVTDAATAAFVKSAGTVTSVGVPAVNAVNKLGVKDTELSGADRYATAAEVATKSILKDSKSAVVANGLNFADPLVGGVYAATNHGALLLTDPQNLSASTAVGLVGFSTSLQDVKIFGGLSAVSAKVETQIKAVLAVGYEGYIQQLKADVAKAQTAVDAAQKAYDAAVAVPGAAEVAFDSAAQKSSDKAVADAETALFDAAKVSTDTKVQAAYAAYAKAVDANARSTARWNLGVAIDGSTDKALGTAAAALDAAVQATKDAAVTTADAAVTKAVQDSAASVKSTGDKLTAAQAALAAAQKALADAQK
ncbi:MAG: cell wall-binding repeat-containing protein [Catenulispora sp.]|nr:cell wall-binding repeat-containing protein [Catenulispora sp.]